MGLLNRLQHSWNAFFMNKDPTQNYRTDRGVSSSYRPDRTRLTRGNERSIVTAIYNRIAMDVAAITIKHCKLDDNGRYLEDFDSGLNNCLTLEANIDQTGRAFIHDAVLSMLDEGVVALVPIDTTFDPMQTASYDILSMRTGKIVQWYPRDVKVRVYNDRTGEKEEVILPKNRVAIVENPLYAVVNEPNSTMQRLIKKLNLLDIVDEQTSAGKLDLIIQLPYVIKSQARKDQAENRRKDIEMQLAGSKYGIAYTDGTERITQLNRPVENNLLKQIEYLTNMLYSQLSFHQTILDGTADEKTMLNYNNRIIEPIVSALVDEMKRTFLTKTARTQSQTIMFFRDPFKLVPVNDIAEIADKFTRNEIMTSNEIRQIVGMKPSKDPKADELRNSNLNHPDEKAQVQNAGNIPPEQTESTEEEVSPRLSETDYKKSMRELDNFDKELNKLEKDLPEKDEIKHYASPYYDPVKAHEYYERTKELKGRKSTSTLNEEGKSVAKYVKEQLDSERKAKTEGHNQEIQGKIAANKEDMNSELEVKKTDMKSKMESHSATMNKKIESLREEFENMSTLNQVINSERIQKEIAKLREDNNAMREELQAEYSADKAQLQSNYKSANDGLKSEHKTFKSNIKTEYDEKYASELDKIKSNPKFLKTSKRKKS